MQGQDTQKWTLEKCIQYAWENSVVLQEKDNLAQLTQIQLEQSKANQGPNLALSARHNYSYDNSYSSESDSWNRESNQATSITLGSSITLYNGAKLKNTIRQNSMNLGAAETSLQTRREMISLEVLNAYINVLLSNEQLKNDESQLETTREELKNAEERKRIGLISEADLLQVKSQLANEKANVILGQSNVQMAKVNLMQAMNRPISPDFSIVIPDISSLLANPISENANEVYLAALHFYPEIKSAEYEVESALTGIDIAKSSTQPELSLFANMETNYNSLNSYSGFADQLTHNWAPVTGLTLSIPIYQRKSAQTKIKTAQIEADNSYLYLTDTKNNLRKAIEQACVDAASASAAYNAMKELYNAQSESFNVAEEMFRQGIISTLDYLIQKNDLATAKNKLSQSTYDLLLKTKVVDYYKGEAVQL